MTPAQREVWRLVRRASVPALARVYREVVAPKPGSIDHVEAQRWVGLSIHGELFRRGVDPSVLAVGLDRSGPT